jgi:hypothetical protein
MPGRRHSNTEEERASSKRREIPLCAARPIRRKRMGKKKSARSVRNDGGVVRVRGRDGGAVGVEEGIDGVPEEHLPILFGISVGWWTTTGAEGA